MNQNTTHTLYYYLKAEKEYTRIHDKENTSKILGEKAAIQYYNVDLIRSEITCLEALSIFETAALQNQKNVYDTYIFWE